MNITYPLILLVILSSCDLGSPTNDRKIGAPEQNKEELEPGDDKSDPEGVLYIETNESKRLKKLMLDTVNNFQTQKPVVDEFIKYSALQFELKDYAFTLPNTKIDCIYESSEKIIEEKVLQVLGDGAEFVKQILEYPNPNTANFLLPVDKETECNDNIERLRQFNTKQDTITINFSDEIQKNREEFERKRRLISTSCKDITEFAGGNCLQHELNTELTDFNINSFEFNAFKTSHTLTGSEKEISHEWSVCYQTPYFSLGFDCMIMGDAPKFKDNPLHTIKELEILEYSRP